MKTIKIISIIAPLYFSGYGQYHHLDTLYANAHQVVSLSFTEPIQKGLTGSPHFTFSFNREQSETLGLLQAEKAQESNLLVCTADGTLYSFVLAYRENLSRFHYFVTPEQRLKNQFPKDTFTPVILDTLQETLVTPREHLRALSQQLLRKQSFPKRFKRKKGIQVKLLERVYHNDRVFMVYEMKNRSTVPFELGQFQLLKILGTPKHKASYQELPITPLFEFQMPKQIGSEETVRLVVVYPKFTLDSEERLQVKVLEAHGSRNLILKLR